MTSQHRHNIICNIDSCRGTCIHRNCKGNRSCRDTRFCTRYDNLNGLRIIFDTGQQRITGTIIVSRLQTDIIERGVSTSLQFVAVLHSLYPNCDFNPSFQTRTFGGCFFVFNPSCTHQMFDTILLGHRFDVYIRTGHCGRRRRSRLSINDAMNQRISLINDAFQNSVLHQLLFDQDVYRQSLFFRNLLIFRFAFFDQNSIVSALIVDIINNITNMYISILLFQYFIRITK